MTATQVHAAPTNHRVVVTQHGGPEVLRLVEEALVLTVGA
jgi:hypothetical protein